MKFSLDKHLDVDLQYIFGSKWNVNAEDLQNYEAVISNAAKRVQRIRKTGKGPGGKAVLFSRLPYILDENVLMTAEERLRLERLDGIGKEQDVLISIGIGGSYLGNQAILIFFMVRTGICVLAGKETGTRRYSLRDRMPTRQRLWISSASFGGNGAVAAIN